MNLTSNVREDILRMVGVERSCAEIGKTLDLDRDGIPEIDSALFVATDEQSEVVHVDGVGRAEWLSARIRKVPEDERISWSGLWVLPLRRDIERFRVALLIERVSLRLGYRGHLPYRKDRAPTLTV